MPSPSPSRLPHQLKVEAPLVSAPLVSGADAAASAAAAASRAWRRASAAWRRAAAGGGGPPRGATRLGGWAWGGRASCACATPRLCARGGASHGRAVAGPSVHRGLRRRVTVGLREQVAGARAVAGREGEERAPSESTRDPPADVTLVVVAQRGGDR